MTRIGFYLRGTLSANIYRKSLKLGPSTRKDNTVGEIVNLMQLDTARMEYVVGSIHNVWDTTFQIIGYTSLLLYFLGPSVLAGIAVIMSTVPINAYFLNKITKLKEINLENTDKRVRLTNEILQGVRAVKSYNWEAPFVQQLKDIREEELKNFKLSAIYRGILVSTLNTAPALVSALTLGLYVMLGNKLDAPKVFTSLALFTQLRFPLIFFPLLLNALVEGKISLRRLTKFLLTDEVQEYVLKDASTEQLLALNASSTDAIVIHQGTFSWDGEAVEDINAGAVEVEESQNRGKLDDIEMKVQKGELVAIVGPTGCGKSTLLSALMGELRKEKGDVLVRGKVAYVPQNAWIPNDSLRNVLLFGNEMEWGRYNTAIDVCGLRKDLEQLEAGDNTEIGERGTNLSGGQKQRISIARAVYEDADVYLFDDPLSALDMQVGSKLFYDCIQRELRGKTRVLVTHQLGVLPEVDRVILMDKSPDDERCKIVDQGTLSELLSRGHDLTKLLNTSEGEEESEDGLRKSESAGMEGSDFMGKGELEAPRPKPSNTSSSTQGTDDQKQDYLHSMPPTGGFVDCLQGAENCVYEEEETQLSERDVEVQVEEEESTEKRTKNLLKSLNTVPLKPETSKPVKPMKPSKPIPLHLENPDLGSTDTSEENSFEEETKPSGDRVSSGGPKLMTTEERATGAVSLSVYKAYFRAIKSPVLLVLCLASFVMANVTQILQQWVVAAWTSDTTYALRPLSVYLSGMVFMTALTGFFNYVRTFLGVSLGAEASRTIHADMIKNVLNAPLSFFESTPVGRLLQRFSKDLDSIDQQLPTTMGQFVSSSLAIISGMFAIITVTPSFALVMAVVGTVYLTLTNYYRVVARELKRVDSLSRSPIYSHFGETLGGLPVIRSFRRQQWFKRVNEVRVDDNLSAYFSLKAVDRWLSIRLEFLGNVTVFFSALLAVFTGSRAGSAGLSLNNALTLTGLLNWAVRNAAETESIMNSVERVKFTIDQTPQEKPSVQNQLNPLAFSFSPELAKSVAASMQNSTSTQLSAASTSTQLSPTSTVSSAPLFPQSDSELLNSGWPWRGGVVFEDVHLRYRGDFSKVLFGVNFKIKPGERIGIVGRTGSGKSSLLRALLRLTEISEGKVTIDGVDTAEVGLSALRSSISIIPQDPVLFSGSIRLNLDPFNTHSDMELWEALRKADLQRAVMALPGGLSYEVQEGGENFSSGQRQLICLARALVRKSKILLLDEATSSVDFDTDLLIQKTIRKEFGNGQSTILTIAHRIDTILDADRVIVMDAGRVGEIGRPGDLLRNKKSLFSLLVSAEQQQKSDNKKDKKVDNKVDNFVSEDSG